MAAITTRSRSTLAASQRSCCCNARRKKISHGWQLGAAALHVAVGEFAVLDARRGAYALNGRHAAQGAQAFGRESSQRTPCPFEFDACSGGKVKSASVARWKPFRIR